MATESIAKLADVRPMQAGDAGLVYDSWLKSYRAAKRQQVEADPAALFNARKYDSSQGQLIDRLLQRSAVIVLCSPSDESEVFGYVVFERLGTRAVLHWLYVKHPFRQLGFARRLFNAARGDCALTTHSHATPLGQVLAKKWGSSFYPQLSR